MPPAHEPGGRPRRAVRESSETARTSTCRSLFDEAQDLAGFPNDRSRPDPATVAVRRSLAALGLAVISRTSGSKCSSGRVS